MTTKRIWAGPTFTSTTTAGMTAAAALTAGAAGVSAAHLDHGKSAAGAP